MLASGGGWERAALRLEWEREEGEQETDWWGGSPSPSARRLTGEVDVLGRMHGPVFEQAVTLAGFAAVTVDSESGTIVWPGGGDLASDTLYERIRTGLWPDEHAAA